MLLICVPEKPQSKQVARTAGSAVRVSSVVLGSTLSFSSAVSDRRRSFRSVIPGKGLTGKLRYGKDADLPLTMAGGPRYPLLTLHPPQNPQHSSL
jgi:hypothetical protein